MRTPAVQAYLSKARRRAQAVSDGGLLPGTFLVNEKKRGDDGTYLLHGIGDASRFAPGSSLYTPDGIIWDVVSIDPDKKGLTVSKKRADVSLAAWLSGDWSKLSGEQPLTPSAAQEAATMVDHGLSATTQGLSDLADVGKWVVGAIVIIAAVKTLVK